ncbi:hypothetical protein L7F22_068970 [Adiantum nelumboides]|nr:hypothetical protein [Adiantum nelumboides]
MSQQPASTATKKSSSSTSAVVDFSGSSDEELDETPPEFYDATMDDRDQAWAERQRKGRKSDALLSCPACFTTLCVDCQRLDLRAIKPRGPNPLWAEHTNVLRVVNTEGQAGGSASSQLRRARAATTEDALQDTLLGDFGASEFAAPSFTGTSRERELVFHRMRMRVLVVCEQQDLQHFEFLLTRFSSLAHHIPTCHVDCLLEIQTAHTLTPSYFEEIVLDYTSLTLDLDEVEDIAENDPEYQEPAHTPSTLPTRHEKIVTQYRAMFVMNCKIMEGQSWQVNGKKRKRKVKTTVHPSIQETEVTGETYQPVACSVCGTEVAVLDQEEVYHFHSVLPSFV